MRWDCSRRAQCAKKFGCRLPWLSRYRLSSWRIWAVRNAGARDHADFDRAVPVATATVARGELPLFLTALGTVTPANAVVVKSRVDGQLLRVHFKEGQFVKPAICSPRSIRARLKCSSRRREGQLARDNALLKNAQIDLERYEMLWSQDSIAKQQVDAQASLVRQYEGAMQSRCGAGGRCETATDLCESHRARRVAASVCARSTPAISCMPPIAMALFRSRRCSRFMSCLRCPKIICRGSCTSSTTKQTIADRCL